MKIINDPQTSLCDLKLFHVCSPQMHLALYCFANGQLSTALKLLYRARYLMLVVCGEDHPEMALLDVSLKHLFCFSAEPVVILWFAQCWWRKPWFVSERKLNLCGHLRHVEQCQHLTVILCLWFRAILVWCFMAWWSMTCLCVSWRTPWPSIQNTMGHGLWK